MARILVLDGDALSLKAMATVLKRAHDVVGASQFGWAALDTIAACRPDLVVLDLHLQDALGLDVLSAIRQRDTRLPVILISRFGHEEDRLQAAALGASDCIDQPLSADLLLAVVHNALGGGVADERPETSHALARWADVVLRGARSPKDMPTLDHWGRAVAVSKGGIRNWCYTARVSPRQSLQFTRVLRAVVKQQDTSWAPEDLLDIVDRRTLAKLLMAAGGTPSSLPKTVVQYLDHQRIIENRKAVAVVRAALLDERLETAAIPDNDIKAGRAALDSYHES